MNRYPHLVEPQLSETAIRVLMRELGAANAIRFLARLHPAQDGKDSVQRHREFAATVEQDPDFLERLLRQVEQENQQRPAEDPSQQTDDANP